MQRHATQERSFRLGDLLPLIVRSAGIRVTAVVVAEGTTRLRRESGLERLDGVEEPDLPRRLVQAKPAVAAGRRIEHAGADQVAEDRGEIPRRDVRLPCDLRSRDRPRSVSRRARWIKALRAYWLVSVSMDQPNNRYIYRHMDN